MNPYPQLARLGGVLSLPAILKKKNGASVSFYVKPEGNTPEKIESEYAQALQVRTWSADSSQFIKDDGSAVFPELGDVLELKTDDGTRRAFPVSRSATTGRVWDWAYTRPGYKVKFYTRYEGAEQ